MHRLRVGPQVSHALGSHTLHAGSMLDAGLCMLRCTCDHTREATHTLRMQTAHRHSRVIPTRVESWPNTHCAWDCTHQHTWCTRHCRHVGLHTPSRTLHTAAHTACTRIAPASTHTAQGVVDCPLTKSPPVPNVLPTKGLLSCSRATPVSPPGTLRVALHRAAPGCPASSRFWGTPQVQGLLCSPGPQHHISRGSPSPSISSWEWLYLTRSGGRQEGLGRGLPAPSLQGGLESPPSPRPAAHSPGPLPLGAGPLCRGFGFQGCPPSCIPAFPGASHSQPGQSPPALIPPWGHLPTEKVSTGEQRKLWDSGTKSPPALTATAFTPAVPRFPEPEVRSSLSMQRTQGIVEFMSNGITLNSSRGSRFWDFPPPQPPLLADATGRTSSAFSPRCGFPQTRWQAQLDSHCLSFSTCRTPSSPYKNGQETQTLEGDGHE